jgi:hypothetical protein
VTGGIEINFSVPVLAFTDTRVVLIPIQTHPESPTRIGVDIPASSALETLIG